MTTGQLVSQTVTLPTWRVYLSFLGFLPPPPLDILTLPLDLSYMCVIEWCYVTAKGSERERSNGLWLSSAVCRACFCPLSVWAFVYLCVWALRSYTSLGNLYVRCDLPPLGGFTNSFRAHCCVSLSGPLLSPTFPNFFMFGVIFKFTTCQRRRANNGEKHSGEARKKNRKWLQGRA